MKNFLFFLVASLQLFAEADKGSLENYAASIGFSMSSYRIYYVRGQGSFFLDNIDDAVKDCIRAGEPWEGDTQKIIEEYVRPGSIAVDIGAHIGTHTIIMSKCVEDHGKVFAFEPQTKIFKELQMNVFLNQLFNVSLHHAAIGEKNTHVYLDEPISGNEGARSIGKGKERVTMKTLDSFHLKNVSFIKIDVENYEDFVLDGGIKTIKKNKPVILIEIQGNQIKAKKEKHDSSKRTKKTLKRLHALGYRTTQVGSWDYLAVPK